MCNLSQGIKEDGIEIGKEIGKAIGEARIIINMHNNGFTAQEISAATNKDLKEAEKIKIISFICVLAMVFMMLPVTAEAATDSITMGLYDSYDCDRYFYGQSAGRFESSDPDVVKIMNDQMIGVSVGSATVTATDGKKKVKRKVIVKNYESYFSLNSASVSLYTGETYTLCTDGTVSKAAYSSRDTSVATVDKNGKIKAKSPGTTFVDVKSGTMKRLCAVTVIDKANKADVITFKADSNTAYASKWKFKNKSKYILAIHPGTYLPKNFETRLDQMIARIEKTSGLRMHPSKKPLEVFCDKPVIWVGGRSDTCADHYGVNIRSADLNLKNESAVNVGRWIANCIIYRNSTYTGELLGSYYGRTVAQHALKGTSFVDANYKVVPDDIETMESDWKSVTASKMESYLTTQNLQSDTESYFSEYLYKTYGASTVNKIIGKINAENKKKGVTYAGGMGISPKRCLAICKSYTSTNVVKDYVTYFKARANYLMNPSTPLIDYSAKNGDTIDITPYGYGWAEYCNYGSAAYSGTVTYDFTEAMKYFTVNCGQKVTGLYGVGFVCGEGEMTLKIYDKNNRLLDTMTGSKRLDVYQDGAVKVKVSGETGYNGFICYYYMTNFSKYATQVQED
ncbi:MAG: Ig-like domain-containing protein [Lachnospiraceae bacterium]|nr:Ig-like domain-containing protein [Lachnospiraceae bacterium]